MSPVLEFVNVSRSFKRTPVLQDIRLTINEGEVVGLLGRNGAGKTTLINLAIGMLYPGAGEVRVFGVSPPESPLAVKRRIGYVPEEGTIRGGWTVRELIAFHRGLFPQWDGAMEREILDRFSLSPKSRVRRLSKGQQRQVALLCAVCHRPELLLLDEPAGGLDPAARREFLETSIQLLNRAGTTILFSTHHMNDVERLGGRVVLLDQRTVMLDENLDRVREEMFVAIVPQKSAPDAATLRRMPGCLRVRAVRDNWHVVVEGSPEGVHDQLLRAVGHNGICSQRVSLEELFVELVGRSWKEDA